MIFPFADSCFKERSIANLLWINCWVLSFPMPIVFLRVISPTADNKVGDGGEGVGG